VVVDLATGQRGNFGHWDSLRIKWVPAPSGVPAPGGALQLVDLAQDRVCDHLP
jgi:hypothetical protein